MLSTSEGDITIHKLPSGHLEACTPFGLAGLAGLAGLYDLVGHEVQDVEQEGIGGSLPHASVGAEPLRLDFMPGHPHTVTLIEVLDEASLLGVDAPCLQYCLQYLMVDWVRGLAEVHKCSVLV